MAEKPKLSVMCDSDSDSDSDYTLCFVSYCGGMQSAPQRIEVWNAAT